MITFVSVRDCGQRIGGPLPENGQTVLIDDKAMGKHVAAGSG